MSRRHYSPPRLNLGPGRPRPEKEAYSLLCMMEDAARRAGLELRYHNLDDDEINIQSGACVLRNQALLLVDKKLGLHDRAIVIARTMAGVDLDNIYLPPAAREFIETFQ